MSAPGACLNCFEPLPDPRPRFCPHCGQETTLRPPRVIEFVQQFAGAFVSTEGALWRTLKLLVLKPGELTRQYLAGRRKHYVLPLRLYLTTSVVTLLLLRLLAVLALDPEMRVSTKLEMPTQVQLEFGVGRAGLRDGVFYCEKLPRALCARIERRLDTDPQRLGREAAQIGERVIANLGVAMFVLLPCFAALTMLAYRSRGLRYTEHLVFALHLHAFWFLAIAFTLADLPWLDAIVFSAIPVYTMLAMKRVFGGRLVPRLARAGLIAALYGALLGIALAVAAVVAFLT